MPTKLLACFPLIVFLAGPGRTDQKLTQADLLRRLIDLERLTVPPPAGEHTGLFSSFDRASKVEANGRLVDWHADNDRGQFIRREPDGWNVMAEMSGPGAITHFWCAQAAGEWRLMLDGKAVVEAPLADLFNGKLSPFASALCYQTAAQGGHQCYFPIGFAQSCQVLTSATDLCYQLDYVRFAPGTQVETFRPGLDEAAQATLAEITEAFTSGLSPAQILGTGRTMTVAAHKELKPGERLTETLDKAGTVRALYVTLTDKRPPRTAYALRQCVLRLYWDGRERPAVEAPLVDFFGSGFERSNYNSLVMGTSNWLDMPLAHGEASPFMYCYFPMPFSDGMKIEIENLGPEKIGLFAYLRVSRSELPADSLRFKAGFREEDPCTKLDFPVLQTTGRGRLVGCTLAVDCPRAEWWGAGDHKIWIDGGPFPACFGTGTADYFGSVVGLPESSDPLHGVTRTGRFGKFSAYRWHIADCVDFHKSIHFALGNRQTGGQKDVYYAAVAYWYGEPEAQDFFGPLRAEDLATPGLRVPGAVEIEGKVRGSGWGSVIKQKYAGGEELSGEAAVTITTSDPVQINIPYVVQRKVRLGLRVHPRRPFEKIEVRDANGSVIGTVVYQRAGDGIYLVGELELKAGDNVLSVICTGKPTLDCWIVEPLTE